MSDQKLKVILLTHGGSSRVVELLAGLNRVEFKGIYIETPRPKVRSFAEKFKRSVKYDGYWETIKKFSAKFLGKETAGAQELSASVDKVKEVEAAAERYAISCCRFEDYHQEDSIARMMEADADLGIIYGTNIVKESVFAIPRMGSINLHQGLAPLYRGGPTVFWELFNNESELGVTVHFVASKVDTGDIVLQKTFPLSYDFDKYGIDYDLFIGDYRAGLVEPSARLVAEAVEQIASGEARRSPQDITQGKRYRIPVKAEKDEMQRRITERYVAYKSRQNGSRPAPVTKEGFNEKSCP